MRTALFIVVGTVLATACNAAPASNVQEPVTASAQTATAPNKAAEEPVAAAKNDLGTMPEHAAEPIAARAPGFAKVEPDKVCMVNNHFMGRAQIPVVVEGKTYFGCCEMCKGRLAKDPSSRVAKDPISGKEVDKSLAVIGADTSGTVQYFEDEANLKAYASR